MLNILLKANVNVHQYEGASYSPLLVACKNGHFGNHKYLIEKCHANPNTYNTDGEAPLKFACLINRFDIEQCLITNGADQYLSDRNDTIPLQFACEGKCLEIVQYLIDIEKDKNKKNKLLIKAVKIACSIGWLQFLKQVFEKENINIHENGFTFLHLACLSKDLSVVKYLVLKGLDKNAENNEGKTILHFAYNSLPIIEYLVENLGLDVNVEDNKGNSPLNYAAKHRD